MKTKIILGLLITFFAFSCKKSQNNAGANKENILSTNTHIVDTLALSAVTANSLVIITTSTNYRPAIGDIILASPSIADSLGVLVKVLSISVNGNLTTCTTQPSNLNEAFRQLYIDYSSSATSLQNAMFRTTDTGKGKGTEIKTDFDHNTTFAAGLEINGALQINLPETQIKYVKTDGNVLPDTVLLAASLNTNGSSLGITGTGSITVPEKTLHTFLLPVILVPVVVGPAVVIIPFVQKIELNILPLNVTGKMNYTVYPSISATLGESYENGVWNNLSKFTNSTTADPLLKTDFDASLTASLTVFNPRYVISPMGLDDFNVYFDVPNDLELKIQTPLPNYLLNYNLNVEAGINAKFWLGIELSKSIKATVLTDTLLVGNFLPVTIDFSALSITGSSHQFTFDGVTFIASKNSSLPGWNNCVNIDSIATFLNVSGGISVTTGSANEVIANLSQFGPIDSISVKCGDNSVGFTTLSACDSNGTIASATSSFATAGQDLKINIGKKKVKRFAFVSSEAILFSISIY